MLPICPRGKEEGIRLESTLTHTQTACHLPASSCATANACDSNTELHHDIVKPYNQVGMCLERCNTKITVQSRISGTF